MTTATCRTVPASIAQVGETTTLPDGPSGTVVRLDHGTEHGAPVRYVTVLNGLGNEITRWVYQPGHQGPLR